MSGKPFPQKTVEDYLPLTAAQLCAKRVEANLCVQVARQGIQEGDARGERALAYYREQRRLINLALQAKRYGDSGPPPQAVQLLPASLAGSNTRERKRRNVVSMEELTGQFRR